MNILFFSRSTLNEKYSFGNTVSALFDESGGDSFYHFYIRKQIPHNRLVREYYNISSADTVRELLSDDSGHRFSASELSALEEKWGERIEKEQSIINACHTRKSGALYFAEEMLWMSGIWQKSSFKRFIKDAAPDVLFAFAANAYILSPLISYVKEMSSAKIVLLIADDVHGAYKALGGVRGRYLGSAFDKCIASADRLYGISDELCRHYEDIYGKPVTLLRKGIELTAPVHEKVHDPVKLVYAGNILYGREKTLAMLVRALKDLNAGGRKAFLEIYTASDVSGAAAAELNVENVSEIKGSRTYAELQSVYSDSDILLHVESFEDSQKELVKYSFSTKISDCLQSGAAVMCIGPEGIASVEYMRKTDGVITVSSEAELRRVLKKLTDDPDMITDSAGRIRAACRSLPSSGETKRKLREELSRTVDANNGERI